MSRQIFFAQLAFSFKISYVGALIPNKARLHFIVRPRNTIFLLWHGTSFFFWQWQFLHFFLTAFLCNVDNFSICTSLTFLPLSRKCNPIQESLVLYWICCILVPDAVLRYIYFFLIDTCTKESLPLIRTWFQKDLCKMKFFFKLQDLNVLSVSMLFCPPLPHAPIQSLQSCWIFLCAKCACSVWHF